MFNCGTLAVTISFTLSMVQAISAVTVPLLFFASRVTERNFGADGAGLFFNCDATWSFLQPYRVSANNKRMGSRFTTVNNWVRLI